MMSTSDSVNESGREGGRSGGHRQEGVSSVCVCERKLHGDAGVKSCDDAVS